MSNVTRDGDTVTVRDDDDILMHISPIVPGGTKTFIVDVDIPGDDPSFMMNRSDLAALAAELHALAGEPDWRAEYEALRKRCNRLIDELAYQMPECPKLQYLELHDMDDDLRDPREE